MENQRWDPPYSTERLTFRHWQEIDAQFVLEMYGLEQVYRFLGTTPKPIQDLAEARARIERWNSMTFGMQGFWTVIPKTGEFAGNPIGSILLLPLFRSDEEPSHDFEIGWHFHPKVWGSGYATEAAQGMLKRAKDFGLPEVHAVVYPENAKSLSVCDRLGMTRLGEADKWYKVTLVDHLLKL